jgi:hypothetical protein
METIPTFIIEHGQCEYCEFDIQDTSQVLKRLIITLYHYVKSIFINSISALLLRLAYLYALSYKGRFRQQTDHKLCLMKSPLYFHTLLMSRYR